MDEIPDEALPSKLFLGSVTSQIDRRDTYQMQDAQLHMLQRFEKTNEMLVNFNALSLGRYQTTFQDFKCHTQLLLEMKKDLENVFRRIRNLKMRLAKQHTEAFTACSNVYYGTDDEDVVRNKPTRSATDIDNSLSETTARSRAPTL